MTSIDREPEPGAPADHSASAPGDGMIRARAADGLRLGSRSHDGDVPARIESWEKRTAQEIMLNLGRVHVPAIEHPMLVAVYAAIAEVTLPGDYAEFGVFRGKCARMILALMYRGRRLHLFDSFEGLPEDWLPRMKAGRFALEPHQIPRFNPRFVTTYKGWFRDTVPQFARSMKEPLSFIHMDADLYSSTIDVLFNIDHLIAPGTIILFDEYVMGNADDEHRACVEWGEKFGRSFEYLWRTDRVQVCVRVTK